VVSENKQANPPVAYKTKAGTWQNRQKAVGYYLKDYLQRGNYENKENYYFAR
jgi:hypothetical protein